MNAKSEVVPFVLQLIYSIFSASAMNDDIKRAVDKTGIYSVLKSVKLDCGDGQQPDGIAVFVFRHSQSEMNRRPWSTN